MYSGKIAVPPGGGGIVNYPSQLFHVMQKTVVALQINSDHTCLCVCLLSKNVQSIRVRCKVNKNKDEGEIHRGEAGEQLVLDIFLP
jgi:hypothetical protein